MEINEQIVWKSCGSECQSRGSYPYFEVDDFGYHLWLSKEVYLTPIHKNYEPGNYIKADDEEIKLFWRYYKAWKLMER